MIISAIIDLFINLDKNLLLLIDNYGIFIYFLLFLVIFCETGLVITPFLPGDSLLFAAGAIASIGKMNVLVLFLILFAAAVLGDSVNYFIGKAVGPKIFREKSRFFKQEYLLRTQEFYERHGVKTIILARFVPIIRTFAPFIAGIGKMNYLKFIIFNIVGGLIWTLLFVFGGYFFGQIPFVKDNFSLVILGIIFVSLIPVFVELITSKSKDKNKEIKQFP